eukprot:8885046-Pyramimonas_sp.AAC.1
MVWMIGAMVWMIGAMVWMFDFAPRVAWCLPGSTQSALVAVVRSLTRAGADVCVGDAVHHSDGRDVRESGQALRRPGGASGVQGARQGTPALSQGTTALGQ